MPIDRRDDPHLSLLIEDRRRRGEKRIEIPFETVDIMKRVNRQPEFLENVNALGGIPVLLSAFVGVAVLPSLVVVRRLPRLSLPQALP